MHKNTSKNNNFSGSITHSSPTLRKGSPASIDERLLIKTMEGLMKAKIGDFVIKGVENELYPCDPDIFRQTYEIAE